MRRFIFLMVALYSCTGTSNTKVKKQKNNSDQEIISFERGETLMDTISVDLSSLNELHFFEFAQKRMVEHQGFFEKKFHSFMNIEKALKIVLDKHSSGTCKITAFKYLKNSNYKSLFEIVKKSVKDTTKVVLIGPYGTYDGFPTPMFEAYFSICLTTNSFSQKQINDLNRLMENQVFQKIRWSQW